MANKKKHVFLTLRNFFLQSTVNKEGISRISLYQLYFSTSLKKQKFENQCAFCFFVFPILKKSGNVYIEAHFIYYICAFKGVAIYFMWDSRITRYC